MSNIFEQVRFSCKYVAEQAKHVKINEMAIPNFLHDLDPKEVKGRSRIALPLKFDNMVEEINFWCVLDLINFGSGYRQELHLAAGRGAFETMMYGVMGLYMSKGSLNTKLLRSLTISDIGEYFQLPLSAEKASTIAGVYVDTPTKLKSLAEKIHQVLTESSLILEQNGYPDFGRFVLDTLKGNSPSAEVLVGRLVNMFPAFNDTYTYNGKPVHIIKKAQLLAADLYLRFKDVAPEKFRFSDIDSLTVFSDNVLPSVLATLGILEYDMELKKHIERASVLESGDDEVELRAVAVEACERIVAAMKNHEKFKDEGINALYLDYYLWSVGKDTKFRSVHRHYTQNTIFY